MGRDSGVIPGKGGRFAPPLGLKRSWGWFPHAEAGANRRCACTFPSSKLTTADHFGHFPKPSPRYILIFRKAR